jgi:hypothetical protein
MRTNLTPSFGTWVVMEVPKRSVNPPESIPLSLSAPSTTNPGLKRSPFFQQILKLGFVFTSCTIDSGPKISGGRIQVSKSIQRKKGLLLRPGCFPHFLHHRSRSQKKWRTNASLKIHTKKERTSFET